MGLASVQAQRDEEIRHVQGRVRRLQELLRDAEAQQATERQKVTKLEEELLHFRRSQKRMEELNEGTGIEYLKNVIYKYIETGGDETLVPVISTILQFSPKERGELKKAIDARKGLFFGIL